MAPESTEPHGDRCLSFHRERVGGDRFQLEGDAPNPSSTLSKSRSVILKKDKHLSSLRDVGEEK